MAQPRLGWLGVLGRSACLFVIHHYEHRDKLLVRLYFHTTVNQSLDF
jgi:hypothetical protein